MMPTTPLLSFSLNAFVRIYAMDPSRQVAEVARRMQQAGGGYDYYRNLNSAIHAHINGKSHDEIEYILNNSAKPDEISYNKSAFQRFLEKFGSKKKISIFEKRGTVKLADGQVAVKVTPSFMVESAGVMSVYHIWASQNPKIDKLKANIACFLMQDAFQKTAPNYHYKFFDTIDAKVYSGFSNTTGLAVASVAENMAKWAKM